MTAPGPGRVGEQRGDRRAVLARRLLSRGAVRIASLLVIVLALSGPARAASHEPLRITLDCQDGGRTKACPDFLRGFIDATPLLLASPRATAQVVLYVNTAAIANADRLHLRFVGSVRGAPESIELDVDLDTRADDDTQRGQLEPAFLRGVALYVAALYPDAVTVALTAPTDAAVTATSTTPWGVALSVSGFGSWTGNYQAGNAYGNLTVTRVEPTSRLKLSAGGNAGMSRSPPVGGVSFDTNSWGANGHVAYDRSINHCYSYELRSTVWRDDPHGQYRFGWEVGAGVEWDRYPSDDPRGNVLAVAYTLDYRVEGYNFPTVDRARFAQYPQHNLGLAASLRKDKVTLSGSASATAELLHPARRYTLSLSPGVEIQLGAHVDLAFQWSITRRELPAFVIPEDDPQAIGRADYAEPTAIDGSVSIRLHWDATNGARNNRFANL